jgi:hypothetical protein
MEKQITTFNRRRFPMVRIFSVLLCALFIQVLAQENGNIYTGSYTLLDNTLTMGAQLYNSCKRHGYEIVKIDVDLVGAGSENSKRVLKSLSSNFNYTICCLGEQTRVRLIYLKVYRLEASGGAEFIKEDTTQLTLRNPVSGSYMIEIRAAMQEGFERDMGYYYLTIAHD